MLKTLLSKFRRDRRGAVAVLIAVAIIPLIAMIGVATDSARGYYARSRLSTAVDAAALAGGQVFFQDRRVTDARQFFDANFPPGFMGSTLDEWEVHPDATETPSGTDKVFSVRASVTVPTTFMKLFGKNTMTVSSYAEVTRESKALDVVLAIDMSTSMTWDVGGGTPHGSEKSRIELAQIAAKKLVDVLYGSETEVEYLRIGVVPWAGMVKVTNDDTYYGFDNVDSDDDGVVDSYAATATRYTTDNSVVSYFNNHQFVDMGYDKNYLSYKSPYGQTTHDAVYYAHNAPEVPLLSEPLWNPGNGSTRTAAYSENPSRVWDGCVWARWEDSGPTADTVDGLNSDWPGWSPRGLDTHLISGYGSTSVKVGENWIPDHTEHQYTGHHYEPWGCKSWQSGCHRVNEYTDVFVAAHWEPQYQDYSNCPAGGYGECTPCPANGITPLTKGKSKIEAAIDRLNITNAGTFYTNTPQGLAWGWRVVSPGAPFTESSVYQAGYQPSRAVILLTDGETTSATGDAYNGQLSASDMEAKLITIANNMKADNDGDGEPDYEIYVIQFANASGSLATLMKSISTEPNSPYYFNAPSGADLDNAFNEIGNHLSNLRLSK